MNKFIIILGLIISQFSFSQNVNKKPEDVYILVNNDRFIGELLRYRVVLSVKSLDPRFNYDNYYFDINYTGLDFQNLYDLGKKIDLHSINYVIPKDFFRDKQNCMMHSELSLMRSEKKRIFIITKIPDSVLMIKKGFADGDFETDEYMVWSATYAGTEKDAQRTQMSRGYFR